MKKTSKEEIDALCKIFDAVPKKGYDSISEVSKTAVDWLIEQLTEVERKNWLNNLVYFLAGIGFCGTLFYFL